MTDQGLLQIDEDEPETPLEQMLGWARGAPGGPMREEALPASIRAALETARSERPEHQLTCLAFHTLVDGEEVARFGAARRASRPRRHPRSLGRLQRDDGNGYPSGRSRTRRTSRGEELN
jgi:hypothetical protein